MCIDELSQRWLELKEAERVAADERRKVEDQIRKALKIADDEDGTIKHDSKLFSIKATCTINRKVDDQKLLDLAGAHNMADQLPVLFRWKPSVNLTNWRNAPDNVKNALGAAITSAPGRATFNITSI